MIAKAALLTFFKQQLEKKPFVPMIIVDAPAGRLYMPADGTGVDGGTADPKGFFLLGKAAAEAAPLAENNEEPKEVYCGTLDGNLLVLERLVWATATHQAGIYEIRRKGGSVALLYRSAPYQLKWPLMQAFMAGFKFARLPAEEQERTLKGLMQQYHDLMN